MSGDHRTRPGGPPNESVDARACASRGRAWRLAAAAVAVGALTFSSACGIQLQAKDDAPSPDTVDYSASETGQPSSLETGDDQPVPIIDGVPDAEEVQRARAEVDTLPTARLAAQLVVPRRDADSVVAAQQVERTGFAGTVHFAEHTPTDAREVVDGVRAANRRIAAAVQNNRGWPAFVAVDQEGGPVTRIREPLTQFGSAMGLGAVGDPELIRVAGRVAGEDLAGLGFTVVLAPVADVTVGPDDPTIGVRSPGSDPAAVAQVVEALAAGYADAGLVSVGKHFPGHGSVTGDTHDGTVHQRADETELTERDLVPFEKLVQQGVPAIMTAHVTVDRLDGKNPATLSPEVLTGLLRERMGFRGLIVTDALEMGAIGGSAARLDAGEAAVRALEAGADVLLMPTDSQAAIAGVTAAVDSGRLPRERLVDSAARLVATLRRATVRGDVMEIHDRHRHDEVAREVAARSITQLTGPCGERLVEGGIVISGGTENDRALLRAAARQAGLEVGSGTPVRLLGAGDYAAAEGAAAQRGPSPEEVAQGTTAVLTLSADPAAPPTPDSVTVALDVPYPLAGQPGTTLAAYGRTPAIMAALVDVLVGARTAEGHLPVQVGEHPIGSGCEAS